MKIITWNIGGRHEPWQHLLDMDADLALLQEARKPPSDVAQSIDVDPGPWQTAGTASRPWRTAVVKLSERVQVEWVEAKPLAEAKSGEFAVSQLGTLAAARVTPTDSEPFFVISMYALWERPYASIKRGIIADTSAHRLISDLSTFIGRGGKNRIIAAGDLNILYGHGEHGRSYRAERYQTVFTRMETLGVPFAGPQAPHGRQAYPWPDELPRESKNVPTYYHSLQTPETATRQVDFVFASQDFTESVRVRAINEPQEWGPSDHCRIEIEIS